MSNVPGCSTLTVERNVMKYTDEAREILEQAYREALQLGHTTINTEHILLAIVRGSDSLAAKGLANLGADLPNVRRQIIELLVAGQRQAITMPSASHLAQRIGAVRVPIQGKGWGKP